MNLTGVNGLSASLFDCAVEHKKLKDVLGSAAPDKAMAGHRTPKFLGEV